MTKKEKVSFVMEKLDELYPEIPIPLDHKDPYTLLIAVLLSAQSTDVGSIKSRQNCLKKQILLSKW